jgi:hypothetical protein
MPKSKIKKEKTKMIAETESKVIKKEEEKELDPELLLGDEVVITEVEETDVEDDDGILLDDDEVDPFKDKWEE